MVRHRSIFLAGCILAACAGCGGEPDTPPSDESSEPPQATRLADRGEALINCGGDLSEPTVRLAWSGPAAASETRMSVSPRLPLEITSSARVPLQVTVLGTLHDRGIERSLEVAHVAIDPGGSARVEVAPAEAAPDLGRGDVAAYLAVRAEVRDGAGSVVETVHADGRSFHADSASKPRQRTSSGTSTLLVYDNAARTSKYDKGALRGQLPREILDNPNVLSVGFHDEAASQAHGGQR